MRGGEQTLRERERVERERLFRECWEKERLSREGLEMGSDGGEGEDIALE